MKLFDHTTCAQCHKQLQWWNVQTCMFCKHALCHQHASIIKNRHSSSLFVVCTHCALQHAQVARQLHLPRYAQPVPVHQA